MTIRVRNPRTGQFDHEIEPVRAAELAATAERLRAGQSNWAALPASARGEVLSRWADAIEADRAQIAAALAADTGRFAISRIEVDSMVGLIRRWARQAPEMIADGEAPVGSTSLPGVTTRTSFAPYPLVGVISPWNFPLTLSLIDTVPALAAGCAVIVKPSEVTPRFAAPLEATIARVPELAEVLAITLGDGETGAALVEVADYICFTGSVPTGRKVAEAAARAFIPACLELGGKDPMIILESADPERAAEIALRASIVNNGQACQSIERVYVADAIADTFLEALLRGARAVRFNYPNPDAGELGPFIFERQARIIEAQIEDALENGARLLHGGRIEELGGGLYLAPTVLVDVTPDMKVMAEETFGPVIPVTRFRDPQEAITLANEGRYGLSAAVIAGTAEEAEAVASRLEVGAVSINDGSLTGFVWETEKTSFRESGLGASRMGASGLLRFLRRRVMIRQSGDPFKLSAFAERP